MIAIKMQCLNVGHFSTASQHFFFQRRKTPQHKRDEIEQRQFMLVPLNGSATGILHSHKHKRTSTDGCYSLCM